MHKKMVHISDKKLKDMEDMEKLEAISDKDLNEEQDRMKETLNESRRWVQDVSMGNMASSARF